jgi:hypothetical protein
MAYPVFSESFSMGIAEGRREKIDGSRFQSSIVSKTPCTYTRTEVLNDSNFLKKEAPDLVKWELSNQK